MLYLINALMFAFLFTIWSKSDLPNVIIKFCFLMLLIANGFGFFIIGSQNGWMNLTGFRFF